MEVFPLQPPHKLGLGHDDLQAQWRGVGSLFLQSFFTPLKNNVEQKHILFSPSVFLPSANVSPSTTDYGHLSTSCCILFTIKFDTVHKSEVG